MSGKSPGSYPVGYAKPPKHSQFQKGAGGNPAGRPKGAERQSPIDKAMSRAITMTVDGKRRRVPVTEAIMAQAIEQSLKGDKVARRDVLKIALQRDLAHQRLEAAQPAAQPVAAAGPTIRFVSQARKALEVLGMFTSLQSDAKIRSWVLEAAVARLGPEAIPRLAVFKDEFEDPAIFQKYDSR